MKNLDELKKLFAEKGHTVGICSIPNKNKAGMHDEYYIDNWDAKSGEHYTLQGLNELYEMCYA
jgi:hypothetical protein